VYYRNPIKIMYTTRLNDGIFFCLSVFPRDIRPTAQIGFCIQILRTFDNIPGIFYLHVEQFLALCAYGFFWICWDYWCPFCLRFGHHYIVRLVSYQRSYCSARVGFFSI
jgi:hypothetical protein